MKEKWSGERLETGILGQVTIEHLHRYALAMEYVAGKHVLDIACGEGYGSNFLAKSAASVTGVDIDQEVIRSAQQKYRQGNLQFLAGNASAVELQNGKFDVIVSFETLEHLVEQEATIAELKRLLQPQGILIISTPDKKWYTDVPGKQNPHHQKELYRSEFEKLLKGRFAHVHFLRQLYFSGSVLLPEADHSFNKLYEGSFDKITAHTETRAPYMIGIASDVPFAGPGSSFFSGSHVLEAALLQQEAAIRNTVTYRTGNTILSPIRWIKKIFR